MTASSGLKTVEGKAEFIRNGERLQTWYKVVGELNASVTPLVLLHGGPGIPSSYLEPFVAITKSHNIPIVLYDQVGAGNSTPLPEKEPSFWSMEHYMDELDNLLKHLQISDRFSILGHSWGSMLGAWYAGTRQPKGLQNLVLADGIARMKDWVHSNETFLKQLPSDVQKGINDYELDPKIPTRVYQDAIGLHRAGKEVKEEFKDAVKTYDVYQASLKSFFSQFVCRMDPLPDPLVQSMKDMGPYPNVNDKVWGPFWLRCITPYSPLGDWDCTHLLSKVRARTLVYNGEWDQAQDFVVEPFIKLIPGATSVTFKNMSHVPHLEDNGETYKVVGDFLLR